MKITIPYSPRKQQAYLHNELQNYRYGLLLCHRRFGKTTMCLNHLIRCAMTNKNYNPRYAYIAPTYKQAKSIAWDFLKFYTVLNQIISPFIIMLLISVHVACLL